MKMCEEGRGVILQQADTMRGCMAENESSRKEGGGREQGGEKYRTWLAHELHEEKKKLNKDAYTEEKGEVGESDWREEEGGRDMRQARADPVRSAASPVGKKSRRRERGL